LNITNAPNVKSGYTMAAPEDTEKAPHDFEKTLEAKPEPEPTAAAMAMADGNALVSSSAATAATSKSLSDSPSPKKEKPAKKKAKKVVKASKVPAKFRTKRPSGTPKRPLSAYNYFFREQRNLMLEERSRQKETGTLPELPVDPSGNQKKSSLFAMMGKTIAKRWKEIATEEHKKYKDLANEDLKRYRTEMDEFHLAQAKESRLSIERIYAKEEMRNKQNAENEAAQKQQFQRGNNMSGATAPGMAGAVQQLQGQQSDANSSANSDFDRLFQQQFGRAPQQGNGGPADYLAILQQQQQQQQQQQVPFMGYNQQNGLNPYGLAGLMPGQAANMNQQFPFGGGSMNGQGQQGGLPDGGGAGQQQQLPQGSYEALLSSMNGAPAQQTMEGSANGDSLGVSMNSLQQQQQQQEQQRLAGFSQPENQNMAGMQQQFLQQQLQQQLLQQQYQQQQQQLQYMNMGQHNGAAGDMGAQPQYNGNK
jgi:hypothetical protein